MKKRFIATLVAMCMLLVTSSTMIFAGETNEIILPATETMIDGIPESQIPATCDVIAGPYFYSYENNKHSTVNEFKQIGEFTHDNTLSDSPATQTVNVTRSTSQGSEWSVSGSINGEIKGKILAKAGAQIGGSYKESRSTNEAVGYTASRSVAPRKMGYMEVWYKGEKIGGALTTYTIYTGTGERAYYTRDINATVYAKDVIAIHSKGYDKNY